MMRTGRYSAAGRRAGFTIIELLIAVIIIGILVAIVINVYTSRAEDARQAAVRADLEAICTAQEHAGIDTAYFYQLYCLDDVYQGDGVAPANTATDRADGLTDEAIRTDVSSDPKRIFIDTKDGDVPAGYTGIFNGLLASETRFNWRGPYCNISKKSQINEFTGPTASVQVPAGFPIDPWGRPYLFFTKKGYVDPITLSLVTSLTVSGVAVTSAQIPFDRPTILSLGRDGAVGDGAVPGSVFGQGDDIYRQF
ncbi:MAG: prepilin-type N-terminal cleavage/methylation domain-containing protein [Candidatus Sumerlaeaceae bacterium]|nr:prepilin-type N-terminal cleavage/methylation domain-containing protein [Candidatus Sumerlaeaceae bacterium]